MDSSSKHYLEQIPKSAFRIPWFIWPSATVLSLGLYYYLPRKFPGPDKTFLRQEIDVVRYQLGLPPALDLDTPMDLWKHLKEWGIEVYEDMKSAVEASSMDKEQ